MSKRIKKVTIILIIGLVLSACGNNANVTYGTDYDSLDFSSLEDNALSIVEAERAGQAGYCGDNITWILDNNGTLVINGTGEMWDCNAEEIGILSEESLLWRWDKEKVRNVVIMDGVTSIGEYAFYDCINLATVIIPEDITEIGIGAFGGTPWIHKQGDYVIINEVLIGCLSEESIITIPKEVSIIGAGAFFGCEELKEVIIPENVMRIGDQAFAFCHGLTKIDIPGNVEDVGNAAFLFCENLRSVSISNGVARIGTAAFNLCYSLEEIIIPDSVCFIGDFAFAGCGRLTHIDVQEDNPYYCSIEDVIFSKDMSELITCKKATQDSYNIPSEVTTIKGGAFAGCGFKKIIIPEGVCSIGDYAFEYCTELESITIPEGVTEIGKNAFAGCTGLTKVVIPGTLVSIGEKVFYECSNLVNVVISEGVPYISDDAFYECIGLVDVVIPESVVKIGNGAFFNCSSLTKLNLPGNLEEIGDFAFAHCSSLSEVTVKKDNINFISEEGVLFNKDKTTLLCYPAGSARTSYSIPNGVSGIENGAFSGCGYIKEVFGSEDLVWIGSYTFTQCTNLTDIILPKNVKSIGEGAFNYCENLKQIVIPDGVSKLEDRIFYNCSSLSKITLPESLAVIENSAFYKCINLTEIYIPENVENIGNSVFQGCSCLTEIVVAARNSHYTSQDGILFDQNKTTLLCYPANRENSVYHIPDGVTAIGDFAFYECKKLINITMPESLVSIGDHSFFWCTNLNEILIPEGVESVDTCAFVGCDSLTDIYFNGSREDWLTLTGVDGEWGGGVTVHYESK